MRRNWIGGTVLEPTSIIASTAVGAAAKAADGIVQRLLGPAADEIGEMLRDKVKAYRAKNLVSVLVQAGTMLDSSGEPVQAVPTRLLLPIIEGASLEDGEELSRKWAGLLASAASARGQESFHPSFPKILSEITAMEAALLDELLALGGETSWDAFREHAMASHGCGKPVINACHGNLFRLGLWRNTSKPSGANVVQLSEFGRSFLRAAHGSPAAA